MTIKLSLLRLWQLCRVTLSIMILGFKKRTNFSSTITFSSATIDAFLKHVYNIYIKWPNWYPFEYCDFGSKRPADICSSIKMKPFLSEQSSFFLLASARLVPFKPFVIKMYNCFAFSCKYQSFLLPNFMQTIYLPFNPQLKVINQYVRSVFFTSLRLLVTQTLFKFSSVQYKILLSF